MKMTVKPIKKINVSDEVFEQMKQKLLHGEFKPGEKIPSENELAEAFGVSRMTARQTVQKLAVLGLVETRLGEGSYVKEMLPGMCMNQIIPAVYLSENSILEVLEFRTVVEGKAAELAALKATSEDVSALEAIWKRMQKYKDDMKQFSDADLEFHFKLASIVKNSILSETYHIINDVMKISMEYIVSICGNSDGLYYHKLLLDAIKAHDGELAKSIMTEHVDKTYQEMLKYKQSEQLE